jgi:hypothetical protein
VPGGRITVSAGFYYLLAVNVLELTLEHLHIEFDKLHSRNKKSCLGTMLAFFVVDRSLGTLLIKLQYCDTKTRQHLFEYDATTAKQEGRRRDDN